MLCYVCMYVCNICMLFILNECMHACMYVCMYLCAFLILFIHCCPGTTFCSHPANSAGADVGVTVTSGQVTSESHTE